MRGFVEWKRVDSGGGMHARQPCVARVVLAVLLLSACGGGSSGYPTGSGGQNPPPAGQPPATTASIVVENNRFDPAATTVAPGTTVTWTWDTCRDDGYGGTVCTAHDVTFDGGGGSTTQSRGAYSRQFNNTGTFNYRCGVHGATMAGQVIVR
jgi:plastocyanin